MKNCFYSLHAGLCVIAPLLLWISVLWVSVSQANDLPVPDTYSITYTQKSPVIDGVLDDAAWVQAKPTKDFVIHDSGNAAPVQTFGQLAYDNQYLYLAATCQDPDIYAKYTKTQAPLFRRDDLVEIFIDPDGDGKNYLELGFSATAVYYSLLVSEVNNGKVTPKYLDISNLLGATQIHGSLNNPDDADSYWTLEARIPLNLLDGLKDVNTSPKSQSWRIGLFRIDYSTHSKTNQAVGYYAWQTHGKFGFHRPERFAHVMFEHTTTASAPVK